MSRKSSRVDRVRYSEPTNSVVKSLSMCLIASSRKPEAPVVWPPSQPLLQDRFIKQRTSRTQLPHLMRSCRVSGWLWSIYVEVRTPSATMEGKLQTSHPLNISTESISIVTTYLTDSHNFLARCPLLVTSLCVLRHRTCICDPAEIEDRGQLLKGTTMSQRQVKDGKHTSKVFLRPFEVAVLNAQCQPNVNHPSTDSLDCFFLESQTLSTTTARISSELGDINFDRYLDFYRRAAFNKSVFFFYRYCFDNLSAISAQFMLRCASG